MKKKIIATVLATTIIAAGTASILMFKKPIVKAEATGKDSYWSSWVSSNGSKTGSTFATALHDKIATNTTYGYANLWGAYASTDVVPGYENDSTSNKKIWDMYGGFQFTYQSKGVSSYSGAGVCYNREHSIPNSWWGATEDVRYSDIICLLPTDAQVNNTRSNYMFGEVSSATTTYTLSQRTNKSGTEIIQLGNQYAKLGTAKTINGVSAPESTVFEPADQYKGDFARVYMYFAIRYYGAAQSTASGQHTFTTTYPYVTDYTKALLLKWNSEDPVSTKETNRNDAVETLQGNRNPFVDYPEWVEKVFNSDNSGSGSGNGGNENPEVSSETITMSGQGYTDGQEISSITGEACTISLDKGTNNNAPKYYNTGTAIRAYGGNTITISSSSQTITGITFTFSSGEGSNEITADSGSYSNNTWSGSSSSVTFTIGGTSGHRRIASITITYQTSGSSEPTLSSIAVATAPTKTTYTAGEYFDPTGLVITRNYSSGSPDTYTYANHASEFSFSPLTTTALKTTDTSVTITYGGKSTTQAITVNAAAKTLSSISVSGQKTSFAVNSSFSFGGTVTATYSDSSTADVTSSATFTGYNMSNTGNQTVTVSYTEGGKTKTTTYQITVSAYRTVMEEAYGVIGTITYTSDEEVISVNSLSTAASGGYSKIDTEYHAWRLGANKSTGTLTVNSTSSNIYKITVNARYYSNDSGTTFTIGGTSKTLTNSYADYIKEYDSPTNSVNISSVTNGKRVLIASITVFNKSNQDIGQSDDCVGLETFVSNYMHMDYTSNLGYCKDNTHHYYSTAKTAFNNLNTHQRSLFTTNSAYSTEWDRLRTWAEINGDSLNNNNLLTQSARSLGTFVIKNESSIIFIVIASSGLFIISLCFYLRYKKKKSYLG